MAPLTTGQLAKQAQVNVETIRYYERRGLLQEPPRRSSGYRQYPEDAVTHLRFIKHAQELGFTLNEIQDLLLLRVAPNPTCTDVRERAEMKIADIEREIESLEQMKQALTRLATMCQRQEAPVSACPILEALEKDVSEGIWKEVFDMARQVEVFIAGCPLCDEAVRLVNELACPSCEVTVHNLNERDTLAKAKQYGVAAAPTIVVDGEIAECCVRSPVDVDSLKAAGIGQPL